MSLLSLPSELFHLILTALCHDEHAFFNLSCACKFLSLHCQDYEQWFYYHVILNKDPLISLDNTCLSFKNSFLRYKRFTTNLSTHTLTFNNTCNNTISRSSSNNYIYETLFSNSLPTVVKNNDDGTTLFNFGDNNIDWIFKPLNLPKGKEKQHDLQGIILNNSILYITYIYEDSKGTPWFYKDEEKLLSSGRMIEVYEKLDSNHNDTTNCKLLWSKNLKNNSKIIHDWNFNGSLFSNNNFLFVLDGNNIDNKLNNNDYFLLIFLKKNGKFIGGTWIKSNILPLVSSTHIFTFHNNIKTHNSIYCESLLDLFAKGLNSDYYLKNDDDVTSSSSTLNDNINIEKQILKTIQGAPDQRSIIDTCKTLVDNIPLSESGKLTFRSDNNYDDYNDRYIYFINDISKKPTIIIDLDNYSILHND